MKDTTRQSFLYVSIKQMLRIVLIRSMQRSDYSLHPHGKQGDPDHNQIQDVKGVPTEGSLVHECSIHCHLLGRNMRYDRTINLNKSKEVFEKSYLCCESSHHLQNDLNGEDRRKNNVCVRQNLRQKQERCLSLLFFQLLLFPRRGRSDSGWLPGSCRTLGQWGPQQPMRWRTAG